MEKYNKPFFNIFENMDYNKIDFSLLDKIEDTKQKQKKETKKMIEKSSDEDENNKLQDKRENKQSDAEKEFENFMVDFYEREKKLLSNE